jgi:hypothetical protein
MFASGPVEENVRELPSLAEESEAMNDEARWRAMTAESRMPHTSVLERETASWLACAGKTIDIQQQWREAAVKLRDVIRAPLTLGVSDIVSPDIFPSDMLRLIQGIWLPEPVASDDAAIFRFWDVDWHTDNMAEDDEETCVVMLRGSGVLQVCRDEEVESFRLCEETPFAVFDERNRHRFTTDHGQCQALIYTRTRD